LDLDAPVHTYVPSFPEKQWSFSTRQMAGHLAGFRHYEQTDDNWIATRYHDVLSALEVFAHDSLLYEPGMQFRYSTHSWTLISAVIEAAAGEPFLDYMQRAVFEPLHLDSMVPEYMDSLIMGRTAYYQLDREQRLVNAPFVDNSWKWAGGGFVATTRDVARFGMAHLQDGFLLPESREMLFTAQRTTDGEETDYGIGWLTRELDGYRLVGHSGGSVGGTAMLMMYPEHDLVVAVMSNRSGAPSATMARLIALAFLSAD
jgi:serine beta-lactamase-like protein LACTB, mitochondrial